MDGTFSDREQACFNLCLWYKYAWVKTIAWLCFKNLPLKSLSLNCMFCSVFETLHMELLFFDHLFF